jgi:hypothetical protein
MYQGSACAHTAEILCALFGVAVCAHDHATKAPCAHTTTPPRPHTAEPLSWPGIVAVCAHGHATKAVCAHAAAELPVWRQGCRVACPAARLPSCLSAGTSETGDRGLVTPLSGSYPSLIRVLSDCNLSLIRVSSVSYPSLHPSLIRVVSESADIDGCLVGGASLDAAKFARIVDFRAK